jgi:hypothetical protein
MISPNFEECIDKGLLTKVPKYSQKAKQLLDLAFLRISFWENQNEQKYSVLKVEAYYEIIKELAFSLMSLMEYNSSNHLCMLAFLHHSLPNYQYELTKIAELRRIRNEINYRGTQIPKEYLQENQLEFKQIIKLIQTKIQEID